ncbi:7,8-dihydropterin-6-yl-methyl-4-(beta-D-ribofuranosyl)aminobenzene 5'-phosphate synthase [Methanophagales archaeon]|nr:7,8-dihydropterin-6-yl-methyl-4-(beta-D-ribofuranosyl)aminobenzene 5'-phosphate synthase [Methanophagales archaeon]
MKKVKLRIIYDNEAKGSLKSDWGFSCMIEADNKKILFDTGASGDILAYNMKQLELKRETIDVIALSHEHWDHIGGLDAVSHPEVEVYLPGSFSSELKKRITKQVAKVIEVSGPGDITPSVHTTGELGLMTKEQSLVLETEGGVVVLTGCAHPGLKKIVDAATYFGDVYGVIGGFHGFDKLKLLREIKMIVPCHCTEHKKEIMAMYPENVVWCGAGAVIEL